MSGTIPALVISQNGRSMLLCACGCAVSFEFRAKRHIYQDGSKSTDEGGVTDSEASANPPSGGANDSHKSFSTPSETEAIVFDVQSLNMPAST